MAQRRKRAVRGSQSVRYSTTYSTHESVEVLRPVAHRRTECFGIGILTDTGASAPFESVCGLGGGTLNIA